MAIIIDGKVYRNLQEQVQKNKDDIETKQDKLIAGDNITINGNTISSKGGSGTPSDYDTVKAQVEANRVAINTEEESRKASYTKVETEISSLSETLDDTVGKLEEKISTVKAQVATNTSDLSDLTDKVSGIEDMVCIDDKTTVPSEINQYITQLKTSGYHRVSAKSKDMTVKLYWSSTSSTAYSNIMKLEVWYDTNSTGYMALMLKGQGSSGSTFDLVPIAAVNLYNVEITSIGTQAEYTLGYDSSYWL